MSKEIRCQGRIVNTIEIDWLRKLINDHSQWSRQKLSLEVCREWNWYTGNGRLKTFAAIEFLKKLEKLGLLRLPPVRENKQRQTWKKPFEPKTDYICDPIISVLSERLPISILRCGSRTIEELYFRSYLTRHHYLGFGRTVGENIQYLIRDWQGRDLACMLFGSAAWKVKDRDCFIGWDDSARVKNLNQITNNTRFLILPWVKISHLASHILSKILRQLSFDWQEKYGHPIHLVETFVEKDRFRGTCYQAANWIRVGETKGRSRQDRYATLHVPIKDIYVYPLERGFRRVLCNG